MHTLCRNVDGTGTSSDLRLGLLNYQQRASQSSQCGTIGNHPYSSFIGDPDYSDDDDIRLEEMFEDQVEFGDR